MAHRTNCINGSASNGNGTNGSYDYDEQFEEIEIPVPWGHISGKWWGEKSQQPILAIHGWQDNAGSFDKLAPLLVKEGYSILAIDLPGHGQSSHYHPGGYYYIFWDGIHIVRRIVKHFKWENVTLIGHSLGGAISFLYASCYPNEVKQYVSIDIPGPTIRNEKTHYILGGSVDKFLAYEDLKEDKIPSYTYEEAFDLVKAAYDKSANEESCRILMKRALNKSKDGGYYFSRDLRLKICALGFFTFDQILGFANKIKCEVLNIRGDPGMTYNKEQYTAILDEIEKSAKKVERHTVPGPHHLHMDNAESISGIISNFLDL